MVVHLVVLLLCCVTSALSLINGAVSATQCLPNATAVVATKFPVRLVYFEWQSSVLNNYVAFILLREVLGYPATINPDYYYGVIGDTDSGVYDMVANATITASIEVWDNPASSESTGSGTIDSFPLGVLGIEGWWYYMPDSYLAQNPLLNRLIWSDLQNPHIASIFQSNMSAANNSYGYFHNALPSWAGWDVEIIRNLNLSLEIVYWGSEDWLFGNMTEFYKRGIPFLTFGYQPTSFFAQGIPMQRLYLPTYTSSCNSENFACDYPTIILNKMVNPALKDHGPGAYSLLQQLVLTQQWDEIMLGLNTNSNYSYFEAACAWVTGNNDTWSSWVQQAMLADAPPLVAVKVKGGFNHTDLIITIIVPLIVVIILVVLGVLVKRHLNEANATVKKMEDDQKAAINIAMNELSYGRLIGRGNFGEVYAGEYRGTPVAIKKLMNQKMTKEALHQFRTEVQVMVSLRHPNILLFMGACAEPPNMSIITEFMKYGNLYDFLHNAPMRVGYKLAHNFALAIAKGMQYIHAAGLLHRDLKTPNVLLDKRLNVKISDFGLSCLAQDESALEHVSLLWTAPEILSGGTFTEKSDVYSFGIILWELLAQGAQPYPDLHINAVAKAVLAKKRPAVQSDWDMGFVNLMIACWAPEPAQRPTFAAVSKILDDMNYEDMDDDSIQFGSTEGASQVGTESINCYNTYMAPPAISNTTTYVTTSVQNALALWEWNANIMAEALGTANKELGTLAAKYKGFKNASNGDNTMLVFSDPVRALSFCMKAQHALLESKSWPAELLAKLDELEGVTTLDKYVSDNHVLFRGLRIGMGVHCGQSVLNTDDPEAAVFHGPTVDHAVKVGALARGGQIVLTQAVVDIMSQHVAANKVTVIVDGTINQNMFSKIDAHFCEMMGLKLGNGNLYHLVAAQLRERVYSGPSNSDLLEEYETRNTPYSIEAQPLVSLPPLKEKWVIDSANVTDKVRMGVRPIGDVFSGTYREEFKSMKVTVQHLLSIKISDSTALKMRAEASTLRELTHPNICTLHGVVLSPLSMIWEHCGRGDLSKMLAMTNDVAPMTYSQRVQFLKDIVAGVAYLKGIGIFVELIPSNLLVDDKWNVKVADYGFAYLKVANQTITQNQAVSWTAPEVFAGSPEDEKAAVYSFAIIMWQLLTRKLPWQGTHSMKIMYEVERGNRPSIEASYDIEGLNPTSFAKYVKLLKSAWDTNPQNRPSFAQIADQLNDL